MIDAVGVIGATLSAIGILQNIRNSESMERKINSLKDAVREIDTVHKILDESKDIHDQYQMIDIVAVIPLMNGIRDNRDDIKAVGEKLDIFISQYEILKDFSISKNNSETSIPHNIDVPSNVIKCFEDIQNLCSDLSESFTNLKKNKNKLKSLSNKNNFGKDLDFCLGAINTTIKRIQVDADRLILKLIPVLSFLHYRIKAGLEEMS